MASFRPLTIVTHPRYLDHDTGGDGHPEVPKRMKVIWERLDNGPLSNIIHRVSPEPAAREWLLSVHTQDYLLRLEEACLSGKQMLGHPDNRISYDTYEVALLAAGAGIKGIDLMEHNEAERVFCCVRPPGHHAEASIALGFCFINNVAVAARYWQKVYGKKRILIFDYDAHHGNGVQECFDQDPNVFYISIHEHPTFSFPGTGYAYETGTGKGKGTTLNIPLLPGAGDKEIMKALKKQITCAVENFKPQALIVAAGFDGHELDDMSGLCFSTNVFGHIGTYVDAWATRYCEGKSLTLLEGGYHLKTLAMGVETYLGGLSLA